jgi:hypothetical protein
VLGGSAIDQPASADSPGLRGQQPLDAMR